MNSSCPELLAPAGTPEAAWAALAYGADAVYAGLPRFSARAEAGNFPAESLDELIGYAHHLGRRVYITFNTLVQQRELNDAVEALALICDLNADGVIVQDIGIVRLIQKNFPSLRLHASTQMAVHNLEGAKQLAAMGFKRVVLARELSLKTIERISRNCGIETETFVHGALCYSYSGLCLFSSHMLGRSGNRGRCAYCCRQPFRDGTGRETLPFSMKDFSAAGQLDELTAAGVASLKIEGRMKSPLYVAAVTDFYRKALDGNLTEPEALLSDIQTIFGRPSTDLYLKNPETCPVDPVNDGHRGAFIGTVKSVAGPWLILHSSRALQKHDGLKVERAGETSAYGFAADEMRLVSDPESRRRFELPANATIALKLSEQAPQLVPGAAVYCSYSQDVRQHYEIPAPRPGQFRQRTPVDIQVFQGLEKLKVVAAADGVCTELVLPGPFEAARQPEKSAAAFHQCFEKLGDTDWKLGGLTIEGPSVFVPVSVLNDARRRLIAGFSECWKQRHCRAEMVSEFWKKEKTATVAWSVKSRRFLPLEVIDEFVLEMNLSKPEEIGPALAFYGAKLRLALPVILREEETLAFKNRIAEFSGQEKWEAGNVGGLNLLRGKKDITADWSLYTLNIQAARQWRELGIRRFVLSPEDDAENVFALLDQLGDDAELPVYQHTPLMISATRPAAEGAELTDRSRRVLQIEQAGREFVLSSRIPFSLVNRLGELKAHGARRFRIDLSLGNIGPEEAGQLVRRVISGQPISGHNGNWERGLV